MSVHMSQPLIANDYILSLFKVDFSECVQVLLSSSSVAIIELTR